MDRRMATPLYYRDTHNRAIGAGLGLSFIVGCLLGASVALAVLS